MVTLLTLFNPGDRPNLQVLCLIFSFSRLAGARDGRCRHCNPGDGRGCYNFGPAGSGIVAVGVHPPKNGKRTVLVQHMPLRNLINFYIHFRMTGMPVTFVDGLVEYFDANGNPSAAGSDRRAELPRSGRVGAPSSRRTRASFCSSRSKGLRFTSCGPVSMSVSVSRNSQDRRGMRPSVVVHRDRRVGGSGEAHADVHLFLRKPRPPPERAPVHRSWSRLVTNHRWDGLRRSGNQVWVNQRDAYDIGVLRNDMDRSCADPNNRTNAEWFAWDEPLPAVGNGSSGDSRRGWSTTRNLALLTRTCAMRNELPCLQFCACGQVDIGVDPTGNCLYGSATLSLSIMERRVPLVCAHEAGHERSPDAR